MLLVTLLAACSDSPPPPTEPVTAIAEWALASVDGDALPTVVYSDDGYSLEVTAGELVLAADGTYTNDVTVTETVDGTASVYIDRISGRWTEAAGGSLTLTPTGESALTASWSGSSLTVTTPDYVLLYSRAP